VSALAVAAARSTRGRGVRSTRGRALAALVETEFEVRVGAALGSIAVACAALLPTLARAGVALGGACVTAGRGSSVVAADTAELRV
jgi:hypothetical protein